MQNKADNCVIHCIDFRFQHIIEKWIFDNDYLDDSDMIAIAGASRDFVKPIQPDHKTNWLRELNISLKLHNPKNIIVIEHQDCGGYATDNTIESGINKEQDLEIHKNLGVKAKKELQYLYPDKNVRVLYVDLDGTFTEF